MTELKSINLGPKRTFTVAESILWTELCGVRFAAEVAATVSLEEVTKGLSKLAGVAKDAAAIRYGNCTTNSIKNYLNSPVFRKRPRRPKLSLRKSWRGSPKSVCWGAWR